MATHLVADFVSLPCGLVSCSDSSDGDADFVLVAEDVFSGRFLVRDDVCDTSDSSRLGDEADSMTPVGGESSVLAVDEDESLVSPSSSSTVSSRLGRRRRVVVSLLSVTEGEVGSTGAIVLVGDTGEGPLWMGATTVCPLMTVIVSLEVCVAGLNGSS